MRVVKTIKWFLIFSALVLTIFLGSILLSYPKKSGIIPISDPIQSLGSNEEPKKYNIIEAYKGNNLDLSVFNINGTEAKELLELVHEEIDEGEIIAVAEHATSIAEFFQTLVGMLPEALKDDPDELEEYIVSDEPADRKLLGANDNEKHKVDTKTKKVKVKDLINLVIDAQIAKDDKEQFATEQ